MVDEKTGFVEGTEPILADAVVAEGAVEGFNDGILRGFAGLDVVDGDTGGLSEEVESSAGKLGTIIRGDDLRQAAGSRELIEDGDDRGTADGAIEVKRQALAGVVIDEGEAAEATPTGQRDKGGQRASSEE